MTVRNEVLIKAPIDKIFDLTSNLDNWVPNLPHYRSIEYLSRSADGNTNEVRMACWRGSIPLAWVSRHEIKPAEREVWFTHLRAFTKDMVVVWRYEQQTEGVAVSITHDLNFRVRALAPLMNWLIGHHFIHPVATRTLATFKKLLEAGN